MKFLNRFFKKRVEKSIPFNDVSLGSSIRLFLDIPYSEKDEAKKLGAKWNRAVKKWYIDVEREDYIKFSKWILRHSDDVIIAIDYLHVIEGKAHCWKCKSLTTVVGLGVGEYIHIYGEPDDAEFEIVENSAMSGEEIHLSWSDNEKNIPPKILDYLKKNYFVKTMYSKTMGEKCFANYCQHCGALQGNYFLFTEPDSVLSSCVDGNELIQRMSKLKIKLIPIEDDLILNWDIGICDNDFAYLEYGTVEELVLSTETDNEFVSYEELYRISE